MKDHLTLEELLDKLDEEGVTVAEAKSRRNIGPGRWHVYVENDKGTFAGVGSSFREALTQAAGNAGAITGRRSMIDEDRPKKRKRREDLLA